MFDTAQEAMRDLAMYDTTKKFINYCLSRGGEVVNVAFTPVFNIGIIETSRIVFRDKSKLKIAKTISKDGKIKFKVSNQ